MEGMGMIGKVIRQYKTYTPMVATKNICYHIANRQRKKSFGNKNPDKTFYVIRSINDSSPFYTGVIHHLLANYFYVISHLKFAQDNGWIPIVDQLNYPVYISKCGMVDGIENPWEYFWEQPTHYTLDEVYNSKQVILSKRSWCWQWDMGYDVENYTNPSLISFYHSLSQQVPLKPSVVEHINKVQAKLFPAQGRVLGVSVRLGGYSKRSYFHAPGHPIAPDVDTLLKLVEDKLRSWNMTHVFLASDDADSVEVFGEAFGDRLLVLTRVRTDSTKVYSVKNPNPIYNVETIFDITLNYLCEMELLSRCTGLIGSVTSGLRYAVVMNRRTYEFVEILDCGRF